MKKSEHCLKSSDIFSNTSRSKNTMFAKFEIFVKIENVVYLTKNDHIKTFSEIYQLKIKKNMYIDPHPFRCLTFLIGLYSKDRIILEKQVIFVMKIP